MNPRYPPPSSASPLPRRSAAMFPKLFVAVVTALVMALLALPSMAVGATPFTIKNFSPGGGDLAADPSGNVWFVVQRAPDPADIVRLTPSGQRTRFPIPPRPGQSRAQRVDVMTVAPDGTLWFQEGGAFGTISPSGTVSFLAGQTRELVDVGDDGVIGSDGNLWFRGGVDEGAIGRVTPAGAVTLFRRGNAGGVLTLGSDGNVWFLQGKRIGRITPTGAVRMFRLPRRVEELGGLTLGPDRRMWFSAQVGERGYIGSITSAGRTRLFKTIASSTGDLTTGPDGDLWFTGTQDRRGFPYALLGRISRSGKSTTYLLPGGKRVSASRITTGGDGTMWFAQFKGRGYVVSRLTLRAQTRARPAIRGDEPTATASASQVVYKSEGCSAPVDRYNQSTWACTTLRTPSVSVASGTTAKVTFHFRIRRTMSNVRVCFNNINGYTQRGCAYKRTYRRLRRGRVIERTMTLSVPDVPKSGRYYVDNRTTLISSRRGWPADGRVCISAPGEPVFDCPPRQRG